MNTFLFLLSNEMLVISAGPIHKMLARITNREDPDQTASYDSVGSASALDVCRLAGISRVVTVFEILEHLPYILNEPRH